MLLALALVRTASAYLLSGTSCRAWRTAARMTATVDAAWDIGTDIEGAEGAAACSTVKSLGTKGLGSGRESRLSTGAVFHAASCCWDTP